MITFMSIYAKLHSDEHVDPLLQEQRNGHMAPYQPIITKNRMNERTRFLLIYPSQSEALDNYCPLDFKIPSKIHIKGSCLNRCFTYYEERKYRLFKTHFP